MQTNKIRKTKRIVNQLNTKNAYLNSVKQIYQTSKMFFTKASSFFNNAAVKQSKRFENSLKKEQPHQHKREIFSSKNASHDLSSKFIEILWTTQRFFCSRFQKANH